MQPFPAAPIVPMTVRSQSQKLALTTTRASCVARHLLPAHLFVPSRRPLELPAHHLLAQVNPRQLAGTLQNTCGSIEQPAAALEALLATGLVKWTPGDVGTPIEYAHPLFQAAIYGDLSPQLRHDMPTAKPDHAQDIEKTGASRHRRPGFFTESAGNPLSDRGLSLAAVSPLSP